MEFGFRSLMNLTCDFAGIDRPKGTQDETDRLLLLMRTFALGTTLAHSKDDREKVRNQVKEALSAFDKEFLQPSMARRFLLIRKCELEEIGEDELPGDVLTVLLRNEDQIELDEQELVRLCMSCMRYSHGRLTILIKDKNYYQTLCYCSVASTRVQGCTRQVQSLEGELSAL